MTKYLRSLLTGVIFEAHERLVGRPEFEEITEQEAFPERFAPVDLSTRESTIVLTIPDSAVTAPTEPSPELIADASRPFGGPKATKVERKKDKTPSTLDVVGLTGAF